MNNKILLLVFLILLCIYGLTQFFSGKRESSFKAELIEVDTADVTSISIDPKGEVEEFTLKREGNQWIVTNGAVSVQATSNPVNSLLDNLTLIRTNRIAAKSPDKWSEYEVAEGEGTRVKVYRQDELLEDFIIGRFSFDQQARSGTSYIRLAGQEEVYAVDGFQMLSFNQGMTAYRNRTLLKLKPEMKIAELDYHTPDSTYRFYRQNEQWTRNGTAALDSAAVATYLNALRNLSGEHFADDFDELKAGDYALKSIVLRGDNIEEPLRIDAYRDTTRERPFVLHSSQYPEVFFESDTSGLYKRVFGPPESFLEE
jgi:hypothetical protein